MKTFALVQGDLSPSSGGYLMVEGSAKINQDLTLALKEEYGTDPFHPRWGSVLKSYIGLPLTPEIKTKTLTEINRVVNNYITIQNARIVQDNNTSSPSRYSTDDVVQGVVSMSAQQIYDSLLVSVTLQTVSRQQININQVIS
jgi:phage baseplate assembly protein W